MGGDPVDEARIWLSRLGASVPDDARTAPDADAVEGQFATGERVSGSPAQRWQPDDPKSGSRADQDAPDATATGPSDADPESVARAIVVRKLSVRAHTRSELETALRARRVPDDAARAVLDRMVSLGLVDDRAFARDWVDSRQQRRHLSRRALSQELTRKGVHRDEVDLALQGVDREGELSAARALAQRKRTALLQLDRDVGYRRLAGMLGRRGFSADVVGTVLRETFDDARPSADA